MSTIDNDKAYEDLGVAVVELAINDYRKALYYLDTHRPNDKNYQKYQALKEDCEIFFQSGHFNLFCGLDGVAVMESIRKEPRGRRYNHW